MPYVGRQQHAAGIIGREHITRGARRAVEVDDTPAVPPSTRSKRHHTEFERDENAVSRTQPLTTMPDQRLTVVEFAQH